MAYKQFGAGDVLTAADVNTYLMNQTVIVCTSGSRPSSPNDGMVIYETDTGFGRQWRTSSSLWEVIWQTLTKSYTPILTAATTNPTLGSGSVVSGRYVIDAGRRCTYWGQVQFGTSGVNAGSGQYFISLPFPAATSGPAFPGLGSANVRDNSVPDIRNGTSYLAASSTSLSIIASDSTVSSTFPWVWAAQDYLAWSITYEVASGAV